MARLATACIVLLCGIVALADAGHLPAAMRRLYAFPGGDKAGHFLLMGCLGFFVNAGFARRLASGLRGNLLATALVLLFATVEEFSQIRFLSRTFSWEDLAASWLGILFFSLVTLLLVRNEGCGARRSVRAACAGKSPP